MHFTLRIASWGDQSRIDRITCKLMDWQVFWSSRCAKLLWVGLHNLGKNQHDFYSLSLSSLSTHGRCSQLILSPCRSKGQFPIASYVLCSELLIPCVHIFQSSVLGHSLIWFIFSVLTLFEALSLPLSKSSSTLLLVSKQSCVIACVQPHTRFFLAGWQFYFTCDSSTPLE